MGHWYSLPARKCAAISLALTACMSVSALPAAAADYTAATSTVVFSGVDVAKDSVASYTGLIRAISGDLSKDGLMFRAVGVYVGYEYDTILGGTATAEIDGDAWIGDIMLGYQLLHPGLRTAVYVGVDYQDHDLTPNDPTNSVNGDEAGFKVVGELETDEASRIYIGLIGSYSTAFDTYWIRTRAGLRHQETVFGIEGIFGGNEGYDNQRLGGFVSFPVPMGPVTGELSISGGYQFTDDEETVGLGGAEGAYGGIGYSFSF